MSAMPLLLGIGDTAKFIGVSRWFVQDLLKTGKLRAVPLNGNPKKRRIYRPDAEQWVKDNLIAGNAELVRASDRRRSK